MSFAVDNGANTTQISTSSNHAQVAGIKFNVIGDLRRGNVQLNSVVGLDDWIGIANGAAIMCNQEWHILRSQLGLLHLAQLVLKVESGKKDGFG